MKKIKNFFHSSRIWFLFVSFGGILVDILFVNFINSVIVLFLTSLWILSIWLYKFEGKISITIGLFFLPLCPFLLVFKKNLMAEKAAIWVYVFLVIGIFQQLLNKIKNR